MDHDYARSGEIAELTVSKYMIWHRGTLRRRPGGHSAQPRDAIVAIDLCVVRTLTFECLFAFLVIGHRRRQLLWFAVTQSLYIHA